MTKEQVSKLKRDLHYIINVKVDLFEAYLRCGRLITVFQLNEYELKFKQYRDGLNMVNKTIQEAQDLSHISNAMRTYEKCFITYQTYLNSLI